MFSIEIVKEGNDLEKSKEKKKTAPCLNFLLILAKISHGYNYSCNQIIEI